MNKLRQIWKILTEPKVYWRLFSLALAFIFWLLAAGEGTLGGTERVVPISVQVQNLPSDMALVNPPENVRVRIRGLAPLLNMAEDSLTGFVDLQAAVEGEGTYGVEVQVPTGVEVISVSPRWIRIQTEQIVDHVFPVTLGLLGVNPRERIQSVLPRPDTVTVTAPRSIMEQVDQVVAYISVGGRSTRLEGTCPVRALEKQGRTIDLVEIHPTEVQVMVEQVRPAEDDVE